MAVKIAPSMRQQFEDGNGNPYVGGKLFTYAAGSSTKQATYTDSTGSTANTNPIILDAAGRTPSGVWLTDGLTYKFVLAPSTDTDPPASPIFTEDVVSGVNDTATATSQWKSSGSTPTYINTTQFTLVGDKTADFHVGRRLKFTVTAGTVYGLITESAYTTLTTVTVVMDSGALDSGLSAVELSILTATAPSLPKLSSANLTAIGVQPLDATLTALAGVATGADKLPYFTGVDAAAQTTITAFTRTLLDDIDDITARATLGLTTGTAAGNVPLVGTTSATETLAGLAELASSAEAIAGTVDTVAITPLKMRNALNAAGTAPIYACRAWVKFDGAGTIIAAGNVTSVTRNAAGDFTVNFTTAMPDANYAVAASGKFDSGASNVDTPICGPFRGPGAAGSVRVVSIMKADTLSPYDGDEFNVAIFR